MSEYRLMSLVLSDAQLIEETPILMIEDPFRDAGLSQLLELTKKELQAGRKYKVAGMYAKKEFLRLTGLKSTLKAVSESNPHYLNKEAYEIEVKEAWESRQFNIMAQQVLIDTQDGASTDEVTGKINATLLEIENTTAEDDEQSLSDATTELFNKWASMASGDNSHLIPTGIGELDDKIFGFPIGEHCIIAARPSVGKSAFGMTCISNQDLMGISAAFLSLEMKTSQCIERIGQMRSGTSSRDILAGNATPEAKDRLIKEIQAISAKNSLQLIHTNNKKLSNVKRLIRRMKKRDPTLRIVFIDYLQIIDYGDRRLGSTENIEKCTSSITSLASELKISIVSLAQLNRDGDGAPKMRHLKGSGQIEQDGYIVILLDRDLSEQLKGNEAGNLDELDCNYIICKNRDGETGRVRGTYRAKTTLFTDTLNYG